MDLAKLSAKKLQAEIAKRDAAHMWNVDAFIQSGRGYMTGEAIREAAKGSGLLILTQLARAWVKSSDARREAWDEEEARRRYHGSDKPIKRSEPNRALHHDDGGLPDFGEN